jgi:hypothetical protein
MIPDWLTDERRKIQIITPTKSNNGKIEESKKEMIGLGGGVTFITTL